MQQRTAIARALANDPKILLLDEPFGALDNQTRALMQEMLLGIWERDQKTVLFVTHDIEEAIFLGSRVLVMSARPGSIKAEIVVDLPHPRSYKIKTTPEFVRLKERLVEEIRVEALKVAVYVWRPLARRWRSGACGPPCAPRHRHLQDRRSQADFLGAAYPLAGVAWTAASRGNACRPYRRHRPCTQHPHETLPGIVRRIASRKPELRG